MPGTFQKERPWSVLVVALCVGHGFTGRETEAASGSGAVQNYSSPGMCWLEAVPPLDGADLVEAPAGCEEDR